MDILTEILAQPASLRKLAAHYKVHGLPDIPQNQVPLLTGMGASYHAAAIAAIHLSVHGVKASAFEATDLLNYASPLLKEGNPLVYISQSGTSGEIRPVLDLLQKPANLFALTNYPESSLGNAAATVLPLLSPDEMYVASQSYANSLALLWLLVRHWVGKSNDQDFDRIEEIADRMDDLLSERETISADWLQKLEKIERLVYVGHGPHAVTARQAAMLTEEWTKLPAMHASIGGFRHGPMEIVQPGCAVVIFASGGGYESACRLGDEVSRYGAETILVVNGHSASQDKHSPAQPLVEEFLSPILDIIPVQLFAIALAESRQVSPGFRHIQKVVTTL